MEKNPESIPRAYAAACRLLARREFTRAEMEGRLKAKGFTEDTISATIDQLTADGFMSQRRCAESMAHELVVSRRLSDREAVERMRRKGLDEESARQEVRRHGETYAEADRARDALVRKWPAWRDLDRQRRTHRAYGFLLRRGFDPGVAFAAIEELESSGSESGPLD